MERVLVAMQHPPQYFSQMNLPLRCSALLFVSCVIGCFDPPATSTGTTDTSESTTSPGETGVSQPASSAGESTQTSFGPTSTSSGALADTGTSTSETSATANGCEPATFNDAIFDQSCFQ